MPFRKYRKKTRVYGQTKAKDKSGTNPWFRSNNIYLVDPVILKRIPNELVKLVSEFFSPDDWDRSSNDSSRKEIKNNKNGKSKKGKKLSKKEIIIKNNTERMLKERIDNELSSLSTKEYDPFLVKVKTEIGKFTKALKCLKVKFNEDDVPALMDIYLCFMEKFNEYQKIIDSIDKKKIKKSKDEFILKFYKYRKIVKKTRKIYDETDIIKYQMSDMGSYLGTLNFLNYSVNRDIKLDEWQIKFLDMIDHERSILLCAPTSSGKTFLTNYLIKRSNRILFIVPTMPLALQVASMFSQHVNGGVWIINEMILTFKKDVSYYPRVIVGTPQELLMRVNDIGISGIDTMVIDEIHEMNNNDAIEPLIHIMSKQKRFKKFLGLSATIGNPVIFHKWLKTLIPNTELIVVNERFFNLSRFVYSNNKLIGISPFNVMDFDLFIKNIDRFIDYPFTPHEVLKLSEDMISVGFNIKNCHDFFSGKCQLTLKDTKEYCNYLFDNLKDKNNVELLKKCFEKYKFENLDLSHSSISNVCEYLSNNKYIPAIIFHLNNITLKGYFDELLNYLETKENEMYPKHQANIIDENKKYKNKCEEIEKRLERIKKEENKQEYLDDNPYPDPPAPIGSPHPDFRFTINGSGTDFSEVNRERNKMIKYFKRKRMDSQIPKLNELFNGLLRGFAIYCEDLPIQYLLYVQELTQKGKLSFVFSDKSLAVGINMPFRNVIFFGDCKQCTPLMVQQMEGRAGRRGLDRVGNSIFVNFSEERIKYLLNTHIEDITSSQNVLKNNFLSISNGINNRVEIIESLYRNNLICNNTIDLTIENDKLNKIRFKELYWILSRFEESYKFCYFLQWFMNNPKLHKRDNEYSDIKCFRLFSTVLNLDFDGQGKIMEWNETDDDVKSCFDHMYQNKYINFDHTKIDSTLFLIFQMNKVPDELRENNLIFSQVKYGLERIRHILSETRNYMKTTTIEEIVRKMERRLKWLQIQGMYIY